MAGGYLLVLLPLCALVLGDRVVDLSQLVRPGASRWPTSRPYEMNVTFNGTTENGYWYQSESVCAGTHFATHLDAPCHFSRGSWCVADIPVERLAGRPAVCIHLEDRVGHNGDYQLQTQELHSWEDQHGRIPDGAVVLVSTGWARFWHDENRYRGTADPSPSQHRFPGVSANAAEWLADQRHVVGVGIDTLSVDYGQTRFYESHVVLGRRNVFILENVANLDKVPSVGITLYAMAVKLDKASGAPARVVAVVNGGPGLALGSTGVITVIVGLVVSGYVWGKVARVF